MLKLDDKTCRNLTWLVLGIIAVLIFATFRDYGVTWDEELQSQYGQAVVDYYTSFFADRRFAEIFNLYLYGGMFDGLASAIDRFTPFIVYDTRHLINGLFGLLGLWGIGRLGRFFGGGAVGLIATLLLALTPMYYGHMFNNPKDIPFAAGVIWTLVYMSKSLAELPAIRARTIIKLGIALGLTLGIRVGGIMVFFFWGAVLAWRVTQPLIASRGKAWKQALREKWRIGLRLALPVALLSYAVMLACWPWAQQSPIMNPLRALNEFSNFPQDVEVLLDGTTYRSTQLPWFYVPLYFAVQLPEFLLVLLAASVFAMPSIWRRFTGAQKQAFILMAMMALVPALYAVIRHPALYDAVRHFLFVAPLLCIPAALTARQAFMAFRAFLGKCKSPALRGMLAFEAGLALLGYFGIHIMLMVMLHPYEYIFVNQFAGGVPGAFGRYELDYWGSSFKEAAQDIQALVAKEGGVPNGKIYRIAICGPWDSAMIYMPPDYEPVVADKPAEFFLSTTRWMCQNMRAGKEVVRIQRMGVPLAVVKDLRATPAPYINP